MLFPGRGKAWRTPEASLAGLTSPAGTRPLGSRWPRAPAPGKLRDDFPLKSVQFNLSFPHLKNSENTYGLIQPRVLGSRFRTRPCREDKRFSRCPSEFLVESPCLKRQNNKRKTEGRGRVHSRTHVGQPRDTKELRQMARVTTSDTVGRAGEGGDQDIAASSAD